MIQEGVNMQKKLHQEHTHIIERLTTCSQQRKCKDALQNNTSKEEVTPPLSVYPRRSKPSFHLAEPNGFGGHDNAPNKVSYGKDCNRFRQRQGSEELC
jgi:hypothetical protein